METGTAVRKLQSSRVLGWRAWTVTEMPAGLRLGSVIYEGIWEPIDTGFWIRYRIDTVHSLDQQYRP